MKKFAIISIIVLLAILVTSCMQPTEAIVQTSVVTETQTQTVQADPTTVINTVVNTVIVVKVVDPITGNEYAIKQGSVGMANADANVNSYFNGLDAHWIGLMLNGDDVEHQFNIVIAPYSNDTVIPAPDNIADWVTISSNNFANGVLTVEPMNASSLYMTLNVPSGIKLPQRWGFTVGTKDVTYGTIGVVNPVRWIVNMRPQS